MRVGTLTPPKSLYPLYVASYGVSPSIVSIHVSTLSTMLSAPMYPFTLALFGAVNVTTVYFLPPTVSDFSVASFAAAWWRKPYGVIQIGSCAGHGVFALTISCCIGPGCRPPPFRIGSG